MNENGLIKIELENILYCFLSSFAATSTPYFSISRGRAEMSFFSSLPLLNSTQCLLFLGCITSIAIVDATHGKSDGGGAGTGGV